MASLLPSLASYSTYKDRYYKGAQHEYEHDMASSATLYVGNLSFYTTEEQIHELFSKCGQIKRIIMGLDRIKHTPCGFCFVEYHRRGDALDCLKYIAGAKIDDRILKCDMDPGFCDGRQFGRGRSGGQVGMEKRMRKTTTGGITEDQVYQDFSVPRGGTAGGQPFSGGPRKRRDLDFDQTGRLDFRFRRMRDDDDME